ncbi:MAG: glycosyl hydrolase [Bacteroidota bacterium]
MKTTRYQFTQNIAAVIIGMGTVAALLALQTRVAEPPASPLMDGTDELARTFQHPPDSARTWTYWFWVNGNITREGITADLEAMARVGIKTAKIFEVSGDLPKGSVRFLSTEWRTLFKHALTEADRLGMTISINNDAGWTGSGGPWNTPENSMQQLVSSVTKVAGGKPFDAVLPKPPMQRNFYKDIVVLAIPLTPESENLKELDKDVIPSRRRYDRSRAIDLTAQMNTNGRLHWDPPAGQWDVIRIGHTSTGKENHPAPESGLGLECDKMSREAVKAHFDGMLAKLIADAGPLAGKVLVQMHTDSWEVGFQNWTPKFREEFIRLRGYDPLPFLPAEFEYIVDDTETNQRFRWDMRMTISDLILENYAGYFRELAAANGMKFSVEAYGAHPGQCPANNLAYAGRADMPMGEFWIGHNSLRSCREMASASHVYGKTIAGAEAFTAWPDNARWQYHPGNLKVYGDAAFCTGINRLVLHCYTHQPWLDRAPGMTMQGWGTHFERTQTWWEQSKPWHEYIARCQSLLQSGLFVADVCYLDVEDAPRDMPYPINLPGYDYDVCNAEVVKTRMSVSNGRITLPDGMSYSLLLLPPTDRMTPETLRKVTELAKAGAVIAATTIPSQSPSLQNYPQCDAEVKALSRELFGDLVVPVTGIRESRCGAGKVILGGDVTQVLTALGIQPDITFANAGKEDSFRWIHRRTDNADFYFIANQLSEEKLITCNFRVAGAQPELWHPETGMITSLPVYKEKADGIIEIPLKFGPTESYFVVFPKSKTTVSSGGSTSGNWLEFQPAMTFTGPWTVKFDPKWGGPKKPVVFETLADWSRHTTDGIRFYSGAAVYQKTFAVDPSVADLPSVFLDLGQVEIAADIKLNGHALGTLWKSPYRLDVASHLKPGDNELEIRVVNLWINRLIGDEHLPEAVEWKDGFMGWGGKFDIINNWPQWLLDGKPSPGGRFTFTTARYYKKNDALKPSGLMGPVQLLMPQ